MALLGLPEYNLALLRARETQPTHRVPLANIVLKTYKCKYNLTSAYNCVSPVLVRTSFGR